VLELESAGYLALRLGSRSRFGLNTAIRFKNEVLLRSVHYCVYSLLENVKFKLLSFSDQPIQDRIQFS
jgi:hypothetical protein